jgi:hypothetical protein
MSAAAARPTTGPVALVGAVRVLGPDAKGYYRLKWINPDGSTGDTRPLRPATLNIVKSCRARPSMRSRVRLGGPDALGAPTVGLDLLDQGVHVLERLPGSIISRPFRATQRSSELAARSSELGARSS